MSVIPGRIDADVMPPLPQNISPDGREIWDWAGKLARRSSLLQKRSDLRKQIADIQKRCGSCTKWMLPYCPKEKHDNKKGHSVGPSMNGYICQQFEMKETTIALISEWQGELTEVERRLEEA